MTVSRQISARLDRLDLYLERIRKDVAGGNLIQAMSDAAELTENSRRLWKLLQFEHHNRTQMQLFEPRTQPPPA